MKIAEILKEKRISGMQIAMKAGVAPSDFYQAMNGKKPFFPAWRKRLSEALDMPESECFPEYQDNKEE
jgi:predicted transcriptional regulator